MNDDQIQSQQNVGGFISQSTTILIVEDSPVEAEILRRSLVRAGYRVSIARDGKEGLRVARELSPAIVISDINMPFMNGYELCHAIKYDEVLWNVPVILLTVLSEPEDIMQAINSGADSYLIKPFDEPTLIERVRALLTLPILIRRKDERRSENVLYNGKPSTIRGGSQQILNLLLSVFENTLAQNRDLMRIQTQLNVLNEHLDDQVRVRTLELLRVNRTLRILSACDVALVHSLREKELLQTICRHLVEIGEYLFVTLSEPAAMPDVFPAVSASAGSQTLLGKIDELQRDPEYISHSITLAAQHQGTILVGNQTRHDKTYGLEKLSLLGICSVLAVPLLFTVDDGVKQTDPQAAIPMPKIYGVLTVFSSAPDAFDDVEVKLMEDLAGGLAFGINSLRTRTERDMAVAADLRSAAGLRRVLEETIAAVALTLEKRDPYAAGHQQRVARLASAIATQMGLPAEQIEGIHFGALLHNIGCVAIPAEILHRPGKLTDLQFAMVKLHPQTGYEIVKDISFPWPVAQMVLQHHERLDGSGYPQGLKGEQIMLEARVLAAADVLEAMMAYRPYRPALGMDEAFAVLNAGRGTRFDARVVDACLAVFNRRASV